MICAAAISLAIIISLLHKIDRIRRTFNRYMRSFRHRDSLMDESVDLVVGILRELMEQAVTSTGSLSPNLFINRLTRTLFLNPVNPKSVFHNLDVIADCRFYGVINYLRENNYRLTQDDLVFCSLICFDFTEPAISLLYGYTSVQSYYNRRSRLRVKLGIDKDGEHIRTYLKNLIQTLEPEKL